jgi:hypothetical protein
VVVHLTGGNDYERILSFPDGGNDPPPQTPPPPIRDPYGYMLRLSKGRLAINSERCSGDNSHENHKAPEKALQAFGVDFREPLFARMVQAEVL